MSKLVHIRSIEMTRAENLSAMTVVSDTTCRFTREVDFKKINIYELAGVTIEENYENRQRIYTTTVTFQTCELLPLRDMRRAFRLTGIDGLQYVVGAPDRPYPMVKVRSTRPEKPSDTTLTSVTITWLSPLPMLLVVD